MYTFNALIVGRFGDDNNTSFDFRTPPKAYCPDGMSESPVVACFFNSHRAQDLTMGDEFTFLVFCLERLPYVENKLGRWRDDIMVYLFRCCNS